MESQRPKLSAIALQALDNIALVPHFGADVVCEQDVFCKDAHIRTALKCARNVISESSACGTKLSQSVVLLHVK